MQNTRTMSLAEFLEKKEWTMLLIKTSYGYDYFYIRNEDGVVNEFYSNIDEDSLDQEGRHKKYFVSFPMPYKGLRGSIEEQKKMKVLGLYHSPEDSEIKPLSMYDTAYVEYVTGETYALITTGDQNHPGFHQRRCDAPLEVLITSSRI